MSNVNIYSIQVRHDVHSEFERVNPVLKLGEIVYVADLDKMKVGDGVTPYNLLPFHKGHLPQEKIAEINEATRQAEEATTNANAIATELRNDKASGAFKGEKGDKGEDGKDGKDGKDGGVIYPSFTIDRNGHLIALIPTTEAEINVTINAKGHLILQVS